MFSYQDGSLSYSQIMSYFTLVLADNIARTDPITQAMLENIFSAGTDQMQDLILPTCWLTD